MTVLFGLFHGLVLFPVFLSLAGPVTNVINPEETSSMDNSSRSTISGGASPNYGSNTSPQGIINTLFVPDVRKQNTSFNLFIYSVFRRKTKRCTQPAMAEQGRSFIKKIVVQI